MPTAKDPGMNLQVPHPVKVGIHWSNWGFELKSSNFLLDFTTTVLDVQSRTSRVSLKCICRVEVINVFRFFLSFWAQTVMTARILSLKTRKLITHLAGLHLQVADMPLIPGLI